MEKTNIIVWVNGSEEWARVYLYNGVLYIRVSSHKNNIKPLADYHIDKIKNI